ncbi:O-sialoglycoprotein endopeptidase [Dehalobacter sp. DCM]|uniref:Kae1-like domain-containing protein n=1 Tax=Dehalobacter sp. DCM TaxID=2907827 RepID=UPI0030820CAD|nr:O-sialoglycoprotein endopeptidase [Dehalobacter sp. DCM]
MLFLGIDTSAYTSSVALVDDENNLIWEARRILEVPEGEKGLAQSEALFHHVRILPELIATLPTNLWQNVGGIGVSAAPRPVENSYMPVFLSGMGIASTLASALQVPLIKTTHQEGHLAAGIASAENFNAAEFLAVHLSGGTTEVLRVQKRERGKIDPVILGATTDLHAGQFIDRVGVRLGLTFPAGKELEKLALRAAPGSASLLPSSVKGYEMSFSGVESAAQRMISDQKRPADIAQAVLGCLVRTLDKVLKTAVRDTGLTNILIVGGVASNKYIRTELTKKLQAQAKLYWAKPEWSSDNAIGVAMLTRETILK